MMQFDTTAFNPWARGEPFDYDSTAWAHALDPLYRHFDVEYALAHGMPWPVVIAAGAMMLLFVILKFGVRND